jgi:hypothetical protein
MMMSRNFVKSITRALAVPAWLFLLGATSQAASDIPGEHREFFEKEVRPLLVKRCFECHDGTTTKGGLSLASANGWKDGGDSGPAIVPGRPEESLLIRSIRYEDEDLQMPPVKKGRLSDGEIAIFTRWVSMGAPDPRTGSEVLGGMTLDEAREWWAFQPIPELPPYNSDDDTGHIDKLIQRGIDRHGLTTAPPADRRTLMRRLSYGLTGLPPSAEEVDAFVHDKSPRALAKVIDRLLESPDYGVHWGRHWLDLVRYADTAGENTDRPLPHAWRYRNWVMEAFRDDMPYDQFVRMQLSGDLLSAESNPEAYADGIIATGYLAIARRFGHDIDKDMYLTYEDVIDNMGKSFLGMTLGCARCHDHKYDPVSAMDYYALYGIFESTKFSFPGCEPKGQPRDLVPLMQDSQIGKLMESWKEENARLESEREKRIKSARSASSRLVMLGEEKNSVISESAVPEGESVDFEASVRVEMGEVLELTVSPNESHGADTTLVEWEISETGGAGRSWALAELVPGFLTGNPLAAAHGGQWCFFESTSGPVFLSERRRSLEGNSSLHSWSIDSLPSAFVNTASHSVRVWTTLPANSFFLHPGHNRPVSVAWVSPLDGEVTLRGRVADAHPATGDGVAFELSHIAGSAFGSALVKLGESMEPMPQPVPKPEVPVAYAVVDDAPVNARFQKAGDPEKPGPEVPRRWLSIFGGMEVPDESGSGRRELGEWVSGHPLAARVMVNRIWEWHFGNGLVRSSNDFGTRGEAPTHPELLDFLALRFIQSGYSVKAMHRMILQTAAWQRSSATPVAEDPDNRWLAHFSRRRLSAEELRDSLMTASGQLDPSWGREHPFPDESSWRFTQHHPFNAVYETNKRSAFMMVQRQRRHPFLALFDGADPNASTPAREATTVPTQALYFINDPFFHQQAAAVAADLLQTADRDVRIHLLYRKLLQRYPTENERHLFIEFLSGYPGDDMEKWSALARVLLASNEYLFVD